MLCRPSLAIISIAAAISLATSPAAYAQCLLDTLPSPVGAFGDKKLSRVLSIDGALALADATENDRDTANILRWNGRTWDFVQQLLPVDESLSVEENFAYSGNLYGDVAVVGTPDSPCSRGERCGAVYVYRFDGSNW